MSDASPTTLMTASEWDTHWDDSALPARPRPYLSGHRGFVELFERFVPSDASSVLEIGCAPGRWLAYFHERFGAQVAGIDYSHRGIRMTARNLELLQVPARVEHGSLFDKFDFAGTFDLAYSLGVVEHFEDPVPVIAAHAGFVRPGGTVIVTVPNYVSGLGRLEFRASPAKAALHNLDTLSTGTLARAFTSAKLELVATGVSSRVDPGMYDWRRPLGRSIGRLVFGGLSLAGMIIPRVPSRWASFFFAVGRRTH